MKTSPLCKWEWGYSLISCGTWDLFGELFETCHSRIHHKTTRSLLLMYTWHAFTFQYDIPHLIIFITTSNLAQRHKRDMFADVERTIVENTNGYWILFGISNSPLLQPTLSLIFTSGSTSTSMQSFFFWHSTDLHCCCCNIQSAGCL